jgi:hypothetical protein
MVEISRMIAQCRIPFPCSMGIPHRHDVKKIANEILLIFTLADSKDGQETYTSSFESKRFTSEINLPLPCHYPAIIMSLRPLTRLSRPLSSRIRPHTFQTTIKRPIHEMDQRSGSELESKKQEHVQKQEKGEGEWDHDLASKGEANVKADREDVEDHDAHMKELQKEGERKGEEGKL